MTRKEPYPRNKACTSPVKPGRAAAQQARVADRPCRGAQDRAFFEERFPDLLMLSSQGRRLTRRAFGGSSPYSHQAIIQRATVCGILRISSQSQVDG